MAKELLINKFLLGLKKQGKQKPIKEHDACEFCEDRYGCVIPCSMKLIEEEKPNNKVEQKFATYEMSLEYVAKRFLETLSHSPYNNRPVVDAQVVVEELLKFLANPSDYNPDAINIKK